MDFHLFQSDPRLIDIRNNYLLDLLFHLNSDEKLTKGLIWKSSIFGCIPSGHIVAGHVNFC